MNSWKSEIDLPMISHELESRVGFKLDLDQIKAIVNMGDRPTQHDIARIKSWVGGQDIGTEDVGMITTKILDFISGYRRVGDTFYFDNATILHPGFKHIPKE